MTNVSVKLPPCVAEEENGGDTAEFAHLSMPLLAEREVRQQRQHLASRGGWVASSGRQLPHDAAWSCQLNWLEKYRQAVGNRGKNKHGVTGAGFLL